MEVLSVINNEEAHLKEIWKDIPNFPGYEASTWGNINSLDREITKSNGIVMKRTGEPMKLTKRVNPHGRETLYVSLSVSGKQITRGVSTIIAETFLIKPTNTSGNALQVGHQDGNPLNNRVSNLKWETCSENMQHAHRTGLITYKKGGLHFNSKRIIQYSMDGEFIKIWDSVIEAAIALDIFQENIATCARGKNKSSGGFKWKYEKDSTIEENISFKGEEWKFIPDCKEQYQVSNYGRIRSVDRCVIRNDGFKVYYKSKILRQSIRNGYNTFLISAIQKRFFTHILVAEVFIGKRPSANYVVDHKDDNKNNNRLTNLQWVTRKRNIQKAYETKVASKPVSGNHYGAVPIDQFDKNGEFIKTWQCTADVCRFLKKKYANNIYDNLKGKRKSAFGFVWRYSESSNIG